MYSPAAAGAEKPHSRGQQREGKRLEAVHGKIQQQHPQKEREVCQRRPVPVPEFEFHDLSPRGTRAAFFPILTYAGARDLKDFAEEWENGHKISGEA